MYKIVNRKKRIATAVLDTVGKVFFLPIRLLRRRRFVSPDAVRRILVIRTAYVGDVVMTLPILKPLRAHYPNATITFLTSAAAAPLLETNPCVDEVLRYDAFWFYDRPVRAWFAFLRTLRKTRYDLLIEARGDIRDLLLLAWPARATRKVGYDVAGGGYVLTDVVPYVGLKHKLEYHRDIVRYLGCPVDPDPEWGVYPTEAELEQADAQLREWGVDRRGFACIHPGSRLRLKQWPVTRFAEVCDRIRSELGLAILLIGAADERALAEAVAESMSGPSTVIAGAVSLREMAILLTRAALFVGNDSAPMHLAAAAGIPAVGIFGPSKPMETAPFGRHCAAVAADCSCRTTCDEHRCHIADNHACMRHLGVDKMLAAVQVVCGQ